jgi:hypothetical protein
MSQGFGLEQVVDAANLDSRFFDRRPEHQSSDSSETINSDFDCHDLALHIIVV